MPRLLSLDGGGSWALIQVRALIDLYGYNATGYDVLADFDLVTANSGGSIVAGALAAGWPLSQTLNLFLSAANRNTIYVPSDWLDRLENSVFGVGPRYDTRGKLAGLRNLYGGFGATPMDQLPAALAASPAGHGVDFIVSAFDYDLRRAVLFRSNRASAAAPQVQVPVVSVAESINASTTAPVIYFDSPAPFPSPPATPAYRFWDGGISGLNNPVLVGVMELLANGFTADRIQVLSIGTGTVRRPIPPGFAAAPDARFQDPSHPGTLVDIKELAGAIVDDPPDEATYMAYLALGGRLPTAPILSPLAPGAFVRMSPVVQPLSSPDLVNLDNNPPGSLQAPPSLADPNLAPGPSPLDNFGALARLNMDAVDASQVNLIQLLATAWIAGGVYNQPVRSNHTFGCEIGHRFYPDAKAAWLGVVGRAAPPPPPDPRSNIPSGP